MPICAGDGLKKADEMTSTVTTKQLGAMIRGIGTATQEAQRRAVINAAKYTQQYITMAASKDLGGGEPYFRNMFTRLTRMGYEVKYTDKQRLSVRWDIKGENNPTALLVARGPWGLLEYGADPHQMSPRLNIRERQKGMSKYQRRQDNLNIAFKARGALKGVRPMGNRKTGFGPVYAVKHPGTKGKKTFSRALRQATPNAERIALSLIQTPIIREIRTTFPRSTQYIVTGESGIFQGQK